MTKWLGQMASDMLSRRPPGTGRIQMICEAAFNVGCKPGHCPLLCPSESLDLQGGPVVHVPYIRRQENSSRPWQSNIRRPFHGRPGVDAPASSISDNGFSGAALSYPSHSENIFTFCEAKSSDGEWYA